MGEKNPLAEERTDWAEDRTLMANERTFAAWVRTGLGSIAVAIGLHAVFGPMQPTWIARVTASIFVVLAAAIFLGARHNAARTIARLNAHQTKPLKTRHMTFVSALLCLGSAAIVGILWII